MKGELNDLNLHAAVASLAFTRSGSRPPPRVRDLLQQLERAQDADRWRILFALVLDLIRKSSYMFRTTKLVADDLLGIQAQLPANSPIRDLARQIIQHEDSLAEYERDSDWDRLLEVLTEIIDLELKTTTTRDSRRDLLEAFATGSPSQDEA